MAQEIEPTCMTIYILTFLIKLHNFPLKFEWQRCKSITFNFFLAFQVRFELSIKDFHTEWVQVYILTTAHLIKVETILIVFSYSWLLFTHLFLELLCLVDLRLWYEFFVLDFFRFIYKALTLDSIQGSNLTAKLQLTLSYSCA